MYFTVIYIVALVVKLCTASAPKIMALQKHVQVRDGSPAVLKWQILVDIDSAMDKVYCTIKFKDTKSSIKFAEGAFNLEENKFKFNIPAFARLKFNSRLSHAVHREQHSRNVFSLTIHNTDYTDTNRLTCKFGQYSSDIDLLVYKELIEKSPVINKYTLEDADDNVTLTTVLCGYPEPKVTMKFHSTVKEIKGELLQLTEQCYKYMFPALSLDSQTKCGERLKLTYQSIEKTLQRSVKITVKLKPTPPSNAQIDVTNSDCATLHWDGTNIGSCLEPTLSYYVILLNNDKIIKEYHTSSNIVEICGEKIEEKSFEARVLCSIENKNSTWTRAELVSDVDIYDRMKTVIITCSVFFVFFIVLFTAYCCYKNKCSLKCSKKENDNLLGGEEGDKDEEIELSAIAIEQNHRSDSASSRQKLARKFSLDTILSDSKTTTNNDINKKTSKTKQTLDVPEDPLPSQKFNSLQRNIERERKKQEEEQKRQVQQQEQPDEFFLLRRNTDSNLLRDPAYNMITPQGPLYDFIPQTRTSQSTASTHDDEEYTLLSKFNPGSPPRDSGNQSLIDRNSGPRYDLLPRPSTRTSYHSELSDASVYDTVPRKHAASHPNTKEEAPTPQQTNTLWPEKSNGLVNGIDPVKQPTPTDAIQNIDDQNNLSEIIYDVPSKHTPQIDEGHYSPLPSRQPRLALHYNIPQC